MQRGDEAVRHAVPIEILPGCRYRMSGEGVEFCDEAEIDEENGRDNWR